MFGDFRLATAASSNEESTNQISEFKKSKETQTTETNTKKMNEHAKNLKQISLGGNHRNLSN